MDDVNTFKTLLAEHCSVLPSTKPEVFGWGRGGERGGEKEGMREIFSFFFFLFFFFLFFFFFTVGFFQDFGV